MLREKCYQWGLLWLRVMMGAGMASHGAGKLFGDNSKFIEGVAKLGFPMPEFFAYAAGASEFFGGLFVIIGLGTRAWAFLIFFTMFVAAFVRHAADPFMKKELALAYWTVSGAIALMGPGRFSIDHLVWRRISSKR